jgi:serine/threonine protein kinase
MQPALYLPETRGSQVANTHSFLPTTTSPLFCTPRLVCHNNSSRASCTRSTIVASSNDQIDIAVASSYLSNHALEPHFAATYTLLDELGHGGFGFVVSAKHNFIPSYKVAVKFIFVDRVPSNAWSVDPDYGRIPTEIWVLKHICHENIIRFLDLYQDSRFFYLVLELAGSQWKKKTR